ncbi:hypothetical protein XHC_4405 [Xanthomonas hortorum pv. carotae str. M081]|nr:hypothetical protein XHC_4405 [Xanthomonas hortorum pv. carotae str. M081]
MRLAVAYNFLLLQLALLRPAIATAGDHCVHWRIS